VVRQHRLLQPAQIKGRQQRQHAPGIFHGPAHVGLGHDVHIVTHNVAHRFDQVHVAPHARGAVGRAPAKTHFHRLKTLPPVLFRLGGQRVQRLAVQFAGVNRYFFLQPAAQQFEHRLARRLA